MVDAKREKIDVITLNVRGLKDSKKRREIFRWLKRYHNGSNCIALLQETHSEEKNLNIWESEWGSKIFASHGTSNARGVAILLPKRYNFCIENEWKDEEGRIIKLTIRFDEYLLDLVNIYAPTKDKQKEQNMFINTLNDIVRTSENSLIVGGDFNTYLDPIIDKCGGKTEQLSSSAQAIHNLCEEVNMVDIFRILNPTLKQYTWRQSKPLVQSRLDYFLVSSDLVYSIEKCCIKPAIKTDHSLITMKIDLANEDRRGPGFWKFNNTLLKDEIYVAVINELIANLKEQYIEVVDLGLKWDLIKADIRQYTIDYSRTQARIQRQYENELHKELNEAAKKLNNNYNEENAINFNRIKQRLEEVNEIKTAGVLLRSKAQLIENNEKNTAYFLNIEKRNYKEKYIKKIITDENQTILDPGKILNEEKRFYEQLYTSEKKTNEKHFEQFFTENIPKLNDQDKDDCDQPITLAEFSNAPFCPKKWKIARNRWLSARFL